MTKLTGKEKRHLRGLGQQMQCLATVGKAGMSEAVLETIDRLLTQRELVKLRLTEEQGADRKAAAEMLADALHADVAGVVGRTVLLYRPNAHLPAEQRITLP